MIDELYRQIGQLKVENEWLKKNLYRLSVEEKRRLLEGEHKRLSIYGSSVSFWVCIDQT
ncbi:MAG: hypothetical protein BroJett041_11720 [Candidatus Jettenia caeni]|nr:MAG: hypothetical protein BroJett041_11720 [Candidatus Jettenia caeni]GJQ45934.1 MAG: hypothetical protein JETCAE04_16880 [Candidatus Jettenia caeni]